MVKKLTKAVNLIVHDLIRKGLNPTQISALLGKSKPAISRYIKRLKDSGKIRKVGYGVWECTDKKDINQKGGTNHQVNQKDNLRLHGQQFRIEIILFRGDYYWDNCVNKTLRIDGNVIKCHRNVVEVYGKKDFFGSDPDLVEKESLRYWYGLFFRLENDLRVTLVKDRHKNIKLAKGGHFARMGSEVCDNAQDHKERLKVCDPVDGKVCFLTDDSFGFREDETVHPESAKVDRLKIDKQINDWRLHDPPTLSELSGILGKFMSSQSDFLNVQPEYAENIKSHIGAIRTLGEQVREFVKVVKNLKK